ncbi:MAG: PAS domain S-box protein [Thermoplasmata archaeon]
MKEASDVEMIMDKDEILVIEEDASAIEKIQKILYGMDEKESFEVKGSTAISEGLQLLSKNHYDAILLDLGLTNINGIDALRLIHKRAPKTPIVVLTDEKNEHLGISALLDGAQDYLVKEKLDKSDLIKSLRHAIERKLIEESLLLKDRAIETSIDCICFLDLSGNIVYANRASIESLGFESPDDIIGRNLFNLFKSKSQSANILRALMETGSWMGEGELIKSGDETIQIQLSASLVKNDADDPLCIMISWIDISERILAEKEIRIRDLAISSSMNAIAISDLDGNLITVNDAFVKLTDAKDAEELVGKPLSILGSKQELLQDWVYAIRASGKWSGEFSIKRPRSNATIWVKAMINLVRDLEKNPLCIIASFMDISDQKKAEEKLFKSEKKYRQLFDLANEGIWVLDVKDTTTLINLRMVEMLGYTEKEMIGKPIYSFVDSASASDLKKFLDDLKEKFRGSHELFFVRKDGTKIYANISASITIDKEGRYAGIIAFITDISIRKQYEDRLKETIFKLNESKQREQMYFDFLAHDIANIVSPIMIYSEMICNSKNVSPKIKEMCSIIVDQARKASSLIGNLRKMEELEGISRDDLLVTELKLAISEAEKSICNEFKSKTFAFSHFLPKNEKIYVKDYDVIEIVLEKILDNAARHTDKSVVEIDVRLSYEKNEPGKSRWRLEISDHGPGIPDSRKAAMMMTADPSQRLTRGIYSSIPFCINAIRHIGGEMKICDRVPNKHHLGTKFVLWLQEGDALDA